MKSIFLSTLVTTAAFIQIGCGSQINQNVQQAILDNQEAKSLLEWESSTANPELLFTDWRKSSQQSSDEAERIQSELCTELTALDGQSLTIFENELRRAENQTLVASCRKQLTENLEKHYSKERSRLGVQANIFKFQPNVQKRDTTNGYFAVTGDVARKEVILTFDDGPSGVYTESILRALREVNAKAMFFMLGKNVRLHADLVKKVAAEGHALGSHSNSHPCLGTNRACAKTNGRLLSFNEAIAEVKSGHQALQDVLGWVDPFFRFPYGESSAELKNYLKSNSVGEFFWSIDSEDWRAQSNETLVRNTLARLNARGRGILLFHDIQRKTAEVMPTLLRELYFRGYSIVLLQSSDETARYNSKLVKKNLP